MKKKQPASAPPDVAQASSPASGGSDPLPSSSVAAAGAAGTTTAIAAPADTPVLAFLNQIKTVPENASAPAPWASACEQGLEIVPPLLELLASQQAEVARNAKRALEDIVRHAGRPNAAKHAQTVEGYMFEALAQPGSTCRADVVWLLSEIGGRRSVPVLAKLLNDPDLREAARCALVRIPLARATNALESAWKAADGTWKHALAEALRARGRDVPATPKLTPNVRTEVTAKPARQGS